MTDPDKIMRQVMENMRRDIHAMEVRVFMGMPACRTFVCQECGRAGEVMRGDRLKCGCGATSAAELLS